MHALFPTSLVTCGAHKIVSLPTKRLAAVVKPILPSYAHVWVDEERGGMPEARSKRDIHMR